MEHVVRTVRAAGVPRVVVVVGYQAEEVKACLGTAVEYVTQHEQLGTGHAVLVTREVLADFAGDVLVLYGDTPLITPETLVALVGAHQAQEAAATVLTAELENPTGYGRILRDPQGQLAGIVEEADASDAERAIREVNTGLYCFSAPALFPALERLSPGNRQGEYYLPDVIKVFLGLGRRVAAVRAPDPLAVLGVNTRRQLAEVQSRLRWRILEALMDDGVTVMDPATTFVDWGVRIGRDTVLHPFTVVEGRSEVGAGCVIGPGAHLIDARLHDGVQVRHSVVAQSELEEGVTVGPFSHVRPGSRLARGARVGNFAEIKNSSLGAGSKVPHHSYVGDTTMGAGVNFGAGAVVVNYDGRHKHRTRIGDRAFIGCNANLVAPVEVGEGAFVAAGSTVTRDVPAEALGIARARQENKPGWARRRAREPGPPTGRSPATSPARPEGQEGNPGSGSKG